MVSDDFHPKRLPAHLRFFLQDFGKVLSVFVVDRHGNDIYPPH